MTIEQNENNAAEGRSGSEALLDAPTLQELKTRTCTNAELQAALVKLIDMHNQQGKDMERAIRRLQQYQKTREDIDWMNTPYGI